LDNGGKKKYYRIYVMVDVSSSMQRIPDGETQSPHDRFLLLVPDLTLTLMESPQVRTTCWLSIVAFNETAHLVLPISPLRQPPAVGEMPRGGQTDYAAALQFLHESIRTDSTVIQSEAAQRSTQVELARPLVFFISDGKPEVSRAAQPEDEWVPIRNALANGTIGARIAAIGLDGADEDVLWKLSTGDAQHRNAFIATNEMSSTRLAETILLAIRRSVQASVLAGDMVIETPDGMRRIGG